MKDITDTVNDVCMVRQCNVLHNAVTVATLPNGLQLRLHVGDKVPYKQSLHVPYKSELIITWMSKQTSIMLLIAIMMSADVRPPVSSIFSVRQKLCCLGLYKMTVEKIDTTSRHFDVLSEYHVK